MASDSRQRYWKSPEERDDPAVQAAAVNEFAEPVEGVRAELSRRNFLAIAGVAAATVTVTGCGRAPVEKAIQYLIQPEEIIPGKSYHYASTCAGCTAGCGMLVRNRDGRPVKLEGNPEHQLSRGGLCAAGQASILELYDSKRLRAPQMRRKHATWEEVDREIASRLAPLRTNGGAVRFLSGTITSPTLLASIQAFLKTFPDARHVTYDALSCSAILDAHEQTHGARLLPHYRFDRAEVIAGFDADFLGTWISPVEFTAGYRAGRELEGPTPKCSWHVHFEPRLSITGAKADRRFRVAPSQMAHTIAHLAARVAKNAGVAFPAPTDEAIVHTEFVDELAARLWETRGRSLVVCGSQDVATQVVVNFINHALGNYGATLDIERPSLQQQGSDRELESLLAELRDGKVVALFVSGANPVYDLPAGNDIAAAMQRVPLVVSFAGSLDETAELAQFVCPDHHFLESWGDAEAVRGTFSLYQPVIHPLGPTRALVETLATWSGTPRPAYDILREFWKQNCFPRQKRETSRDAFWDRAVHDGFVELETPSAPRRDFRMAAVRLPASPAPPAGGFELVLYPKVGILDGRHADNAWLQELPDPISKVTWDHYACLSPQAARELGVREGDVVRIRATEATNAGALELPVHVQPGQHDCVVAVALGYGRKATERFAKVGPRWMFGKPTVNGSGRVGANAAPFAELSGGMLRFARTGAVVEKTGARRDLACTQSHHTLVAPKNLPVVGGQKRTIVEETTWAAFLRQAKEERKRHEAPEDLWPPDHVYNGRKWTLAVDMNACTGCSACVVACQAENNIPVVGRDEVLRQRELHWLRVDRYYSGEEEVDVVHQPMMCQQCDNAPCETVCPVLATVHSAEGLNQQIYNRCVGTRYCANNCPYKTRRFNWFNYPQEDHLQNLALNPDVSVRMRGIMEKCTFCVQRIQEAKIEAKRRGEPMRDGEIQTACQQTCPAQAIVFGDLNDPKSRVAQLAASRRAYRVLDKENFKAAVSYLAVVRNREEEEKHG